MQNAQLYGANPTVATLSHANLSDADLSSANLTHEDLEGADLTGTTWIATTGAIAGVLWVLPNPVSQLRDLPQQEEPR